MDRERLTVLFSGFAIAAFAGLAAYFRGCITGKSQPKFVGVLSALSNGGCVGIAVCGFCYWKWEGKAEPVLVFGLCSVMGLGGGEMITLILNIVRHRIFMKTPEE